MLAQILIQLELHTAGSSRTSTYRSRDISAPYAIQAWISCFGETRVAFQYFRDAGARRDQIQN